MDIKSRIALLMNQTVALIDEFREFDGDKWKEIEGMEYHLACLRDSYRALSLAFDREPCL